MKKILFSLMVFTFFSVGVQAQKYFTYDGSDFNVLITCDNANTKVTDVEFSADGEWVPFTVVGKSDLEGTKEGGFMFFCRDGEGKYFAVDYYRTGDYVLVHAVDATSDDDIYDENYSFLENPWKLTRRK